MRKLNIPIERAVVWKTGLPFYDAARLIGAAHRLFGTASSEVEDLGAQWVISGPLMLERHNHHLGWVLDGLPPYAASSKKLRSTVIDGLLQHDVKDDTDVSKRSRLYYYIESALQAGARGPDPLASYRNLASQAGVDFQQPLEDVGDAAFGVSFAAVSRGRREEGERRVLPIFEDGSMVIGPFLDFRRSYRHEAGVQVAAVWASLSMLEDLIARELPVVEFAYNWVVPRVQSSSGLVGVDTVCRTMRQRLAAGQPFAYGGIVRGYLAGTRSSNAPRLEHDMARALTQFTVTQNVRHLETIVRLKTRLMTHDTAYVRNRVQGLFRTTGSIQEVKQLTQQTMEIPWGLTGALAQWFIGGGSNGWIGQFIKLENASTPERFLDEAERILSRARIYESPVSYSATPTEQQLLHQINRLGTRDFRGVRALILLDIQAKMTYYRGRNKANDQPPSENETSGE